MFDRRRNPGRDISARIDLVGSTRAATTLVLVAGVCGAIQPKVNAALGDRAGSGIVASLVNFAVALAVVAVAVAARPPTRGHLRHVTTWDVPRWTLTAGLLGVVVVLSGVLTVETIGVAVFSVAFFAGQITAGVLVDRLGISPGAAPDGDAAGTDRRLLAAGIAVVAVVVAQLGRDVGDLAPGLVAFAAAAGVAASLQAAFNGRITSTIDDPVAPTAVNVVTGTVALAAVVATLAVATDELDALDWPGNPLLYTGGALGVTIVLALAVGAAALGVVRMTLTMLAAQLVAACGVDWIADKDAPTPGVVAGSALVLAAVRLSRSRPG